VVAEYYPLIVCSISFVLCFCVYANFSCTVCYKMFKYKQNKMYILILASVQLEHGVFTNVVSIFYFYYTK